jgi:hypothetical protein
MVNSNDGQYMNQQMLEGFGSSMNLVINLQISINQGCIGQALYMNQDNGHATCNIVEITEIFSCTVIIQEAELTAT